MNSVSISPIGTIYTPYNDIANIPIQPIAARGIKGYIELLPEYMPGLKDLNGFSYITLIYYFHKVKGYDLEVIPFMDSIRHGIFACKAPKRPNPIGISTVKLIKIEKNIIHIEQVDMLYGTPLLDIKPFYPKYDNRQNVKSGWLENKKSVPLSNLLSDDRFRDK